MSSLGDIKIYWEKIKTDLRKPFLVGKDEPVNSH